MAKKEAKTQSGIWTVPLTECQMNVIKELVDTAIAASNPMHLAQDYDGITKRVALITLEGLRDDLNNVTG
jgi:hypothetical protein